MVQNLRRCKAIKRTPYDLSLRAALLSLRHIFLSRIGSQRSYRCSIAAILLLFCSSDLGMMQPAFAELKWRGTGPGGGGAFASAAVSTEGVVFVGSDLSGVYASVNGGESWRGLGYAQGVLSTHVDSVTVDPQRPARVFLGADNGLYVSTDCGIAVGAACHFTHKFEAQVSVVQSSGTVAYAAGLGGYCQEGALLWRSDDHGETWAKVQAEGLPRAANIMGLRIDPQSTQHVIAISTAERFSGPDTCGTERWPDAVPLTAYESKDGGAHFAALTTMPVEDVKFDLSVPQRLWITIRPPTDDVVANGEVYMRDGNGPFKLLSAQQTGQIWPLHSGGIRLLDLRRQRPWHNKPFIAEDQTGFWQWDEVGHKFTHVTTAEDYQHWDMGWSGILHAPQASLNGHLQSFIPVNDDEAWWMDDQFVHHITEGGKHVVNATSKRMGDGSFVTRQIDNAVGAVLASSPVDLSVLYAGYFDMGCWRSENAQAAQVTWRDCNGGQSLLQPDGKFENSKLNGDWHGFGGNVVAIAPDPEDAKIVWAVHAPHNEERGSVVSGFYTIAKSSDGFATYDDVTFDLTTLTNAAAIVALNVDAPTKATRRLWAIAAGKLYKLDDGAKSWVQIKTNGCDGGLLVIARLANTMLLGGNTGVCVSHDGGNLWRPSRGNERLGEKRNVWWAPFDATPFAVSDFAFDPSNALQIYMTVLLPSTDRPQPHAGLYRSDDAGETWSQVKSFGADNTMQHNFARTVAVNPSDPKMIVVGTSVASVAGGFMPDVPMGAFISRDSGKTWTNENAGLNWPFITSLRFAGKRLYALSSGQGIVFSDVK